MSALAKHCFELRSGSGSTSSGGGGVAGATAAAASAAVSSLLGQVQGTQGLRIQRGGLFSAG